MKVTRNATLGIGALFFLLVALGLYILLPSYCFIVSRCNFIFDNYFAENIKNNIVLFGQEKLLKKPFFRLSPALLKQEFPLIKTVQFNYMHGGILSCLLKAIEPVLIINNSFCCARDGGIYDKSFFCSVCLSDIPSITIQSNEKLELSIDFRKFIQQIPLHLFENFAITWVNHTFVTLHDKKLPQWTLIAHYQTDFNDQLLHHYERIKQEFMTQRLASKKQWVVDVRFKNQIVVAQKNVEIR